jgi:soluble lytic murein transglycosylase-like protein
MFETAKVNYNTLGSALGLGGLNPYQQGQQQALQLQQQQEALQQQEAEKQQALQMQKDLMDFSLKKNQDPKELLGIMTKYPQYAKQLTSQYEGYKTEEKQSMIKDGLELYSVLSKGTPEQKKAYLDLQYESAVNSGDEEAIASAESVRDLYNLNPDATLSSIQMNLGALVGFDKFANFIDKTKTPEDKARQAGLIEQAKNEANPYFNAQQQADLQSKIANTALTTSNIKKADAEAGKIMGDINRQYGGQVPLDKAPEYESKLRNELTPLLKKNREAQQAYNQMTSIFKETGKVPGIQDVAAVVSFFKSIDPTSTVTSTETGQIQGATGTFEKFASLWNKTTSQGNFTQRTRDQLLKTAGEIYQPLKNEADSIKNKYKTISDKMGIDFNNVDVIDFNDANTQSTKKPSADAPISDILNYYNQPVKKKMNNSKIADAVKQVESGGDANAISNKGAVGTMQTMPSTLKDPGFGVKPAQNNSSKELERVGTEYLGAMQNKYDNLNHALIAYNWGTGNTDKWIKKGAKFAELPKETQNYVKKINKILES